MVKTLRYSNTNTYLIKGSRRDLLFDTGWAGTFPDFCRALGEAGESLQTIGGILISHYHPDHMGIAQEIAERGPVLLIADFQKPFVHGADAVFAKEGKHRFVPINEETAVTFSVEDSRSLLAGYGIEGEILATPGHSDDSISLLLDDGTVLVGDLNPLYELECHKGTRIAESWEKLLSKHPKRILYGHAREATLEADGASRGAASPVEAREVSEKELYQLVAKIMKYIDRKYPLEKIRKKTGASAEFVEQTARMYLTHQNVGVQGILDRIELRKMY